MKILSFSRIDRSFRTTFLRRDQRNKKIPSLQADDKTITAVFKKVGKLTQEPEEKLWGKKNLFNAAINSCV